MPEYRLTSGTSIVENVNSANDENVDIINFDVPDKIMFPRRKIIKFMFPSELLQMYYVLQLMSLSQR